MDVTRIIELPSKTYVEEGDYVAIDNQQDGTQKVQFTNLFDSSLSQSNKIAPANTVGQQFTNTNAEINALRAAVGSPLTANTSAAMTDHDKIYVYTGATGGGFTQGNWYYYNGTAWVSGGVYNSIALETDKTLTVSDMAADAKVTGNEINDLKNTISDNQVLTDELISKTTDFVLIPYAYNNANKSINVNSSGRIGLGNQSGRTTRIYDVSALVGQAIVLSCVIPENDDYGFPYAISDNNGDCIGGGNLYPSGINFVRHRVVIPTGATYIYVTSLTTDLPSVEILGNSTKEGIQLNADTIENLTNETVGLRFLSYIYNETDKSVNVNSSNMIGLGNQSGRTTRVYDITSFRGKIISVSGTLPANDLYQRIYAISDVDGVCVGSSEQFPDGITLSEYRIKIPSNASYLYVTSLTTSLPTAKVVSWSSLNRLLGKTAVTFGDSITWYDGHPYHGLDGSKEEGVIAKGYQSYMRELGMIVDNKGYDGHHLPDIVNDKILPTDFTDYEYATITSGANDSRYDIPVGEIEPIGQNHGTSTFIGALQTGIEHILTSNPQTKIVLMTPIRGWIYYPEGYPPAIRPSKSGDGVVEEKYAIAIKEVGKFYGIPVCDWYNLVTVNELTRVWFMEDPDPDPEADPNPNPLGSLHPTTAGFKCMSGFLIETLKQVW